MRWIDYRNIYDMLPHYWVIESLNTNENSKKIGEFYGKNNEVLDGGADLWYWDSWGSTY